MIKFIVNDIMLMGKCIIGKSYVSLIFSCTGCHIINVLWLLGRKKMKNRILRRGLLIFLAVVMMLLIVPSVVIAEDISSVTINNSITVFEAEATYTVGDGVEALFACTKGNETFEALVVDKATGTLQFENGSGAYEPLRDKAGNPIVLNDETPKQIAAIYNDIKGTVRYFAGGTLAYYGAGESQRVANDIPVSSVFVSATGVEELTLSQTALTKTKVYNAHNSGTSEIVGIQAHVTDNSVRFVAGVDMLWYTAVGFDVELYADGVYQGVENLAETHVFSGVLADGEYVYASEYGYEYFSVFAITNIDVSDGREYYVIVKPYTCVDEDKYYGTAKKINIGENEYAFDESYNENEDEPIVGPTIVIGNATGNVGDEVTITFDLLNSPQLYAMFLTIGFDDTALTLISESSGEAMDAFTYTKPSQLKSGANFMWSANDPATANGTVLELVFKINDGATVGDYAITMTCDPSNTYDADDNDVNLAFVEGSITVIK